MKASQNGLRCSQHLSPNCEDVDSNSPFVISLLMYLSLKRTCKTHLSGHNTVVVRNQPKCNNLIYHRPIGPTAPRYASRFLKSESKTIEDDKK